MYILAGLLLLGLIANALVRPLPDCWFRTEEPRTSDPGSRIPDPGRAPAAAALDLRSAIAWAAVGLPIAWGVWVTLSQALVLFSRGA
jgi:hypothetical protein